MFMKAIYDAFNTYDDMKVYLEYRGEQIGLINQMMSDVNTLAKDVATETKV